MAALTDDAHTWQKKQVKNGESAQAAACQPPKGSLRRPLGPSCPQCSSRRVWRDGLRKTEHGDVQRWLCRDCGFRFSETSQDPPDQVRRPYLAPNRRGYNLTTPTLKCQVCVSNAGTKNLSQERTRQEWAAGATPKPSESQKKTILFNFAWYMKKQGYRKSTIRSYVAKIMTLLNTGADVLKPESVKAAIASANCEDGSKKCYCDAYDLFVKKEGLTWSKPRYKPTRKLPFIPTEKELDTLIMGCGKKMRAFLEGLKQTGADPGELFAAEWCDVDFERKKVTINHPVKGHDSRIINVSDEWLRMLSRLPRTSDRLWGESKYHTHYSSFKVQRQRLAYQLGNPRIQRISFRTFRHWKGTTEYHKTHDLLHVKRLLGHKSVQNTEIYISLEEKLFEQLNDEYIVRRAVSVKGMLALAATGFTKFDEANGVHLYRKPKPAA